MSVAIVIKYLLLIEGVLLFLFYDGIIILCHKLEVFIVRKINRVT